MKVLVRDLGQAAILAILAASGPVLAQGEGGLSTEDRLRALEDRLREQEDTIRRQEEKIQRLEQATGEADPAKVEAAVDRYLAAKKEKGELADLTAGWDKGFFLKSADDKFKLTIGGYGYLDGRWFQRSYGTDDTFFVREARVELEGHLWKNYEYKISFENAGSSTTLRDAFLNFHWIDEAQFKIGQYKEPFSLDQLASSKYREFVERSRAGQLLAPGRDVGAQAHGKLAGGIVEYAVGFFNGDGLNTTDSNDEKDVAARVVLSPFKTMDNYWTKSLQVGGNVTHGQQFKSLSGRSFTTAGGTRFFTFAAASRHEDALDRYGADLAWLVGPASLKGEWIRFNMEDVEFRSGRTIRFQDFLVDAWYVSGSYVLSGEDRTWKGVAPKSPFDPKEGGWGAWELALRYQEWNGNENMIRDGYATGTEDLWATTLGLNWYLNTHVRVMLDYEYTRFRQDVAVDGDPQSDEQLFAFRVQFVF